MENSLIEELNRLFTFVPLDRLKESVSRVYFFYLIHTETLPEDYKNTTEDIYFLLNFLERAGDLCLCKGAERRSVNKD